MNRKGFAFTSVVVSVLLIIGVGCSKPAKKTAMSVESADKGMIKQLPAQAAGTIKEKKAAPAAANPAGEPKVIFEQTTHDFGDIGPGKLMNCEFKFTNAGSGELKVFKKIQSTCGCTVPELEKEIYAPGESGVIKVSYHASKLPGPITKNLFVMTTDKAMPKVELAIKANIKLKVSYTPTKLDLTMKGENGGCQDIRIISLDDQSFAVTNVTSTNNVITADFNSTVKSTEVIIKPKVDVQKMQASPVGTVNIGISHPEVDVVEIPYNMLLQFETNPKTIVILRAKPNEVVTRKAWLLNNYNEDYEVESTSSDKGIIKAVSQQKIDNRYEFELQITVPPENPAMKVFSDTFIINIKGGKKIEITCRGFYGK